jgi:hypothetical protein
MEQGNMSINNIVRLEALQEQLLVRLRGGTKKADARDSNSGYSLAKTVVNGGTPAKTHKKSGSVHNNSTLANNRRTENKGRRVPGNEKRIQEAEDQSLQDLVYDTICNVTLETFGHKAWFKTLQGQMSEIPDDRLIPGRRVPLSHIWWTSNPKCRHVHLDTNTTGAAFVFCAKSVKGGELVVNHPCLGATKIHLIEGKIVGGLWAQYPHCNEQVDDCEDRHSFVVYLDHRAISQSYIFLENNRFVKT